MRPNVRVCAAPGCKTLTGHPHYCKADRERARTKYKGPEYVRDHMADALKAIKA